MFVSARGNGTSMREVIVSISPQGIDAHNEQSLEAKEPFSPSKWAWAGEIIMPMTCLDGAGRLGWCSWGAGGVFRPRLFSYFEHR